LHTSQLGNATPQSTQLSFVVEENLFSRQPLHSTGLVKSSWALHTSQLGKATPQSTQLSFVVEENLLIGQAPHSTGSVKSS